MTERLAWRPARWLRLAAGAVIAGLVATLFHQGAQPYAVGLIPSPWDKLVHMALFAVLALLLWLLMGARRPWLVLGTACLIGLADEWAQLSLPGRQAGLDDLFADAAGAVLMLLCLTRVARSAWVTDARGELR